MTSILGRIFGYPKPPPLPSAGDLAFDRAMKKSDELMRKMRDYSSSTDAPRAVMADIWAQRHNVPFLTTVYEAAQEMKAATDQKPR